MYVSIYQSSYGLIIILIIGFKFFTWSERFNSLLFPTCFFIGSHLVSSSVEGSSVFTPEMLYYPVNRGFNSFTLVEYKMEHNEQPDHELKTVYQPLSQPVLWINRQSEWHLSSPCLINRQVYWIQYSAKVPRICPLPFCRGTWTEHLAPMALLHHVY